MKLLRYFTDELGALAAEGGWIFWVLVALAFAIAFALISIVHFLRLDAALRPAGGSWLGLLRGGRGDRSHLAELLPMAQDFPLIEQRLFDPIERRIRFAFVLIGAAPLVGLLGTVSGMLATFHGLSGSAARAPMDVISGGVSEALITTQTGLVIAVPTFIVATLLKSRLQHLRMAFCNLRTAVRRLEIAAEVKAGPI